MSSRVLDPALIAGRRAKLRAALESAPFGAVLALSAANVDYASGYRSVAAVVHGTSPLGALVTADRLVLAGPVSDSAPAYDADLGVDDYLAYGRFYYESEGGLATPTRLVDQHPDYAAALLGALAALPAGTKVGIDDAACPHELRDSLERGASHVEFVPASAWLAQVRQIKLAGEVALIERAARIVEHAMLHAIDHAQVGMTEAEIARLVAGELVAADFEPRFLVVTAGERSALSDAFATDRVLQVGDLLRFDVGGMYQGYWADLGRTAVAGEPDARQSARYAAILAGEQAQFELARPGVAAQDVFARAVEVTERAGLAPYRRHHCGHGIGLEVYEAPIIRPDTPAVLEPGMTFCFETPFYEIGWGGMMVEDALVVTEDGIRLLSDRRRELQVIPA